MPEGTKCVSITPYGDSFFNRTYRIETTLNDETILYFMKVRDTLGEQFCLC